MITFVWKQCELSEKCLDFVDRFPIAGDHMVKRHTFLNVSSVTFELLQFFVMCISCILLDSHSHFIGCEE